MEAISGGLPPVVKNKDKKHNENLDITPAENATYCEELFESVFDVPRAMNREERSGQRVDGLGQAVDVIGMTCKYTRVFHILLCQNHNTHQNDTV